MNIFYLTAKSTLNYKPICEDIYQIPASERGAMVFACAGLINQLQSCWFDPAGISWRYADTAIVGNWVDGDGETPRP